jgi:Fic family protein
MKRSGCRIGPDFQSMREGKMSPKATSSSLSALRQARRAQIESARQTIKMQNRLIKAIREQITLDGKTVPEISQNTGLPTSQVLRAIAGLRKYGMVAEVEKQGDYYRYAWVPTRAKENAAQTH